MMTTTLDQQEDQLSFDSIFLNDQISRVIDQVLPSLNRKIKKYMLFHLLFLISGLVEVFLFFFFLTHLIESSLLAISLSVIFFSFFSYYIFRIYLYSQKPNQLVKCKNRFIQMCKEMIKYRENIPEHHLALAKACTRFAAVLHEKECNCYYVPSWLDFLSPMVKRFSYWYHWKDVYHVRELLLLAAVEEHIELIKFEPTDLEGHAALANAYVTLSGLYAQPHPQENHEEEARIIPEKFQEVSKRKFTAAAERAIEEFKILNYYAPDNPWVHLQLAYSYHDLGMYEEEIQAYEAIVHLISDDKEILFKLGALYFQQGQNAKGLQIYEELKKSNYKKAEELIQHYGDYARNIYEKKNIDFL